MKNNSFLRLALATAGLWLLTGALATTHAQPGTGGPAPQAPDPAAVPLDGGASLLVVAGVGMGLRKLRQRRRAA
ncbi:PID-CTERM protein-sorting domain-containing protein [Hymenobacter bucti]|uniref:PID-CTERM protein-sorting domain-containing protein n=1 Tax=Hymenobacter bucti TaxID=1844114 RepID=A0ABW4QUW6_9BACT